MYQIFVEAKKFNLQRWRGLVVEGRYHGVRKLFRHKGGCTEVYRFASPV